MLGEVNNNRFGLSEETIASICNVFLNYPQVETVILYGSRAKGNYKNGSDIDLTFIGQNLDLRILNRIDNDIDDILLPYSFDLSIKSHISNADLLEHIERVGKIFYQKQGGERGRENEERGWMNRR